MSSTKPWSPSDVANSLLTTTFSGPNFNNALDQCNTYLQCFHFNTVKQSSKNLATASKHHPVFKGDRIKPDVPFYLYCKHCTTYNKRTSDDAKVPKCIVVASLSVLYQNADNNHLGDTKITITELYPHCCPHMTSNIREGDGYKIITIDFDKVVGDTYADIVTKLDNVELSTLIDKDTGHGTCVFSIVLML